MMTLLNIACYCLRHQYIYRSGTASQVHFPVINPTTKSIALSSHIASRHPTRHNTTFTMSYNYDTETSFLNAWISNPSDKGGEDGLCDFFMRWKNEADRIHRVLGDDAGTSEQHNQHMRFRETCITQLSFGVSNHPTHDVAARKEILDTVARGLAKYKNELGSGAARSIQTGASSLSDATNSSMGGASSNP